MKLWSALFQCLLPHGAVADGRPRSFSNESDAPGSDRHTSIRSTPSSFLSAASNSRFIERTCHASASHPLSSDGYIESATTASLIPSPSCHTPIAFVTRPPATLSTPHHVMLQRQEEAQLLPPTPAISAPANTPSDRPPSAPVATLEPEASSAPSTSPSASSATTGRLPASAPTTKHLQDSTNPSTLEQRPSARARSSDVPSLLDKSVAGMRDAATGAMASVVHMTPMYSCSPTQPNQAFGQSPNTQWTGRSTPAAAAAGSHNSGVVVGNPHKGMPCAVLSIEAASTGGVPSSMSNSRLSSTLTGGLTTPLPAGSPAQQVAATLLSESSTVSISDTDDEADYGPTSSLSMLHSALATGGGTAAEAAFIRGKLAELKQFTLAGFEDMGGGDILPGLPRVWFAQKPNSTRAPLGSQPLAVAPPASAAAVGTDTGVMVVVSNSNASAVNEVRSKILLNPEVHEANLASLFSGGRTSGPAATAATTGGCGAGTSLMQQVVQPLKPLHEFAARNEGDGCSGKRSTAVREAGGESQPNAWPVFHQLRNDSHSNNKVPPAWGGTPAAAVAVITKHGAYATPFEGRTSARVDADPSSFPQQSRAATMVAPIVMPQPQPPRLMVAAPQQQQPPLLATSQSNSSTRAPHMLPEKGTGAAAGASRDAAAAVTAAGLRYAEMLQQIFARATAAHQLFREQQQQQQQQQRSAMKSPDANAQYALPIELVPPVPQQHHNQLQLKQHQRPSRQQVGLARRNPDPATAVVEHPDIRRVPQQEPREQLMLTRGVGPSSESLPLPLSCGGGIAAAVSGAASCGRSAARERGSSLPASRQSEQGLSPFASALLPRDIDRVEWRVSDAVTPSGPSSCAGGLNIEEERSTQIDSMVSSPMHADQEDSQLDSIKLVDESMGKSPAQDDLFGSRMEAVRRPAADTGTEPDGQLPSFRFYETSGLCQPKLEGFRASIIGNGSGDRCAVLLHDDPIIQGAMQTGQLSTETCNRNLGSGNGSVGSLRGAGGDDNGHGEVSSGMSSGGEMTTTTAFIPNNTAAGDDILSAPLPAAATAAVAEVTAFKQQLGDEQRELLAQLVHEKWSPFNFPLSKAHLAPLPFIGPGPHAYNLPLTETHKAVVTSLPAAPMAAAVAPHVESVPQAPTSAVPAQVPASPPQLIRNYPYADMLQPHRGLVSIGSQPAAFHSMNPTSQPEHPLPHKPYGGMLHGLPVAQGHPGPDGVLRHPPLPPGVHGVARRTGWLGSISSDIARLPNTRPSAFTAPADTGGGEARRPLITSTAITTGRSIDVGAEGSGAASSFPPHQQPHLPPSQPPDFYDNRGPAPRVRTATTTPSSSKAFFGAVTGLTLSSDPEPLPQPPLAHLADPAPEPVTSPDLLGLDPEKIQSLVKCKWSPFIDLEASLRANAGPRSQGAQVPAGWPALSSAASNRLEDGNRPRQEESATTT